MNSQQAFSLVYLHYFKRGGKMGCPPGSDKCYMRMLDDQGNAIGLDPMGVLIPASDYVSDMEERSVDELVSLWPRVAELAAGAGEALLSALVGAHDEAAHETTSVDDALRHFREAMLGIAKRFGLVVPAL